MAVQLECSGPGCFADWDRRDSIRFDLKRQLAVGNAPNLTCVVNERLWRTWDAVHCDTHRAKSEYTVGRDQEVGTLSTSM